MTNQHTYLQDHTIQGRKLVFRLDEELAKLHPLPPDRDRAGVALLKQSALNVVLTAINAGAHLSEHEPRGPATIHVIEGRIRVNMDGEQEVVERGQMIAFDANVRREAVALEDSAILTTVALEPEGP